MTRKTTEKHVPHEAEDVAVVEQNHESQPEVKAETVPTATQHSSKDGKSNKKPSVPAQVLLAEGTLDLVPGSLLVICARPGFKRAGIEHERMKAYGPGELTDTQLVQLRREPLITVVKVG